MLRLCASAALALAGCDVSVSSRGAPVADVVRICRAAIDALAGAEAGAAVEQVSESVARLSYGGKATSMGAECRIEGGRVLFPAATAAAAGPSPPKEIRYRLEGRKVLLEMTYADGSRSTASSVTTGGDFDVRVAASVGDASASVEEQ